jgi:hypothetical protein
MRTFILLCGMLALSSVAKAYDPAANVQSNTPAVFKEFASIVGEWTGAQDGHPVKVTYVLTGDGSALMETVVPLEAPASTMITMFTADGNRLLATHYCAAHNQPQMTADHVRDLSNGVTFRLTRVTGMKTPNDWHNTGLTFVLDDADHITQHWTSAYNGKAGANTFHYTRVGK